MAIFLARPERRFAHQIADDGVGGQDFFPVAGLTGAVFDQFFHAALIEVGQPFFIAQLADPVRVGELVAVVAPHHRIEIGADFEQLVKVVVPGVEQMIEKSAADDDDFSVDLDRFRFQSRRGKQREGFVGFHFNAAAAQHAFQDFPHRRFGDRVLQAEDQIAAMGAQQ